MIYTYKPTIRAIQYTGNIDKVTEFIGRENLQTIETIVSEDKIYERLFVVLKNCRASQPREFFLSYGNYLIKESLGKNIKFKFMHEEEFVEYYEPIVADTTPCEDNPKQIGEENQQLHDEINLLTIYDNWRKQHDPVVLDWRNGNQQKWFLYYDYEEDDMNYTSNYSCRRIGALCFSACELAKQFYTEHKDLIHRVLGVE